MKTVLIAAFALSMATSAFGAIPLSYTEFQKIYGSPVTDQQGGRPVAPGGKLKFEHDGMVVYVTLKDTDTLGTIEFTRDSAFNALEIEDILKPLSVEEKWKQTDEKNWVLEGAKAKAHWNGEGKITVQ